MTQVRKSVENQHLRTRFQNPTVLGRNTINKAEVITGRSKKENSTEKELIARDLDLLCQELQFASQHHCRLDQDRLHHLWDQRIRERNQCTRKRTLMTRPYF